MRGVILSVLLPALLLAASAVNGQQPVRQGPVEKLVLDGFEQDIKWGAAEATVTRDTQSVKDGQASMRLHIAVDYQTGEPNYPVGWPRTNLSFSEPWQRNWSGWDFLHFWILATTSREALPRTPLGLILHTPDKARAYNRTLSELKKGEWVQVRIPLSEIARHEDVRMIQFAISESNYTHGDQLDFYFDDLSLMRYVEPVIEQFAAARRILLSGERWLPVRVRLLGIPAGKTAQVRIEIRGEQKTVVSVALSLGRGEQTAWVSLGEGGLAEGQYTVSASLGAERVPDPLPVRVISSPWEAETSGKEGVR